MIRAYDKEYVEDAMENLGEAVDYAVHGCRLTMDEFFDFFIASGLSKQFGEGAPRLVAGLSGTELVWEAVHRSGRKIALAEPEARYDCTPEYWCGWILAYYQWYTGRSFETIRQQISMKQIEALYPTHHEASEEKFVDTVEHIIQKKKQPTRLQHFRKISGCSQRELAEKSGVSLRSIQQYEQRAKDINKASAVSLMALARAIGCRAEDLME